MPKDYRIFVGAFPNGVLGERLQALRERYDPKTAAITAPHVTLAGTYWRTGPPTRENESIVIERLESAFEGVSPFELHLAGIHTLPGRGKPVIYLGVELTPELLSIRQILLSVLGADKHRRFTPHLTLAMRLRDVPAGAMLDDLRRSEWSTQRYSMPINRLMLMQRGQADPTWRAIAELNLNQNHDT
jgi:2'-5' RNA ligase